MSGKSSLWRISLSSSPEDLEVQRAGARVGRDLSSSAIGVGFCWLPFWSEFIWLTTVLYQIASDLNQK